MKRLARLATALCALLALGMDDATFAYERELYTEPGWTLLELPDEVFAHGKPGLGDLRVEVAGAEVPWVLEHQLGPTFALMLHHGSDTSWTTPILSRPLLDVESLPGRETTALLDQGEHAHALSGLSVEVEGSGPFLKPLIVEAGVDRTSFREIARASIFRVPGATATTVRFPTSDRRYLRLRLDDRNGEPIKPLSVVMIPAHPESPSLRELPAQFKSLPGSPPHLDVYSLELPSANLPAAALSFQVQEPAFSRQVTVYQRSLFRDEVTRRVVGQGRIFRGVTGPSVTTVPLSSLLDSDLEIEVERAGVTLPLGGVSFLLEPQRIAFRAPSAGAARLLYGAPALARPDYDLEAALGHGPPKHYSAATLGPERVRRNVPAPVIAPPPRAPLPDAAQWKRRQPIELPVQGNVAYLDLGGEIATAVGQVRIVDASDRQLPYVLETASREQLRTAKWSVRRADGKTELEIELPERERALGIELSATAPDYFLRPVEVSETVVDGRGPTGRRSLGRATWQRRPGEPAPTLSVAIEPASAREVTLEIADGDNPPLAFSALAVRTLSARIDFVFTPGEKLWLLSDNDQASAPRYDLELLSGTVLASPALAAALRPGAPPPPSPPPAEKPRWFWLVLIVAVALVGAALARTLRGEGSSG